MKKVLTLIVTLVMFVTIFSACGSKKDIGDMKAGSWTENTFTNTWSDISITIPDDYYALTLEEEQSAFGSQKDLIINGSDKISGVLDPSKGQTLFDFAIASTNQSLVLGYENLVTIGKLCSAENYLKITKKRFLSETDKDYKYLSTSTSTIAGDSYAAMSFSLTNDDGIIYSDIYAKKHGSYMIFFITSYTSEGKLSMSDILDSVTKAGKSKSEDAEAASDNSNSDSTADAADGTTLNRSSPKVQLG